MPINTITGLGGSGKTFITVYFLNHYPKMQKYGNFQTKLKNYEVVDLMTLFSLNPDYDTKLMSTFDEAYGDFDQRLNMTEEGIINTYLPFQARKNNMSILGITQLPILDIRWKGVERYKIHCETRKIYNQDGSDYKGDFFFWFIDVNTGAKVRVRFSYRKAKKYFSLYDTKEKVFPKRFELMKHKIEMKDPKKRNMVVKEIVDSIIKFTVLPPIKKITHDWVKDKMLDLEMDLNLEKFVYIRLRNIEFK